MKFLVIVLGVLLFYRASYAADLRGKISVQNDGWTLTLTNGGPKYVQLLMAFPNDDFERYIVGDKLSVFFGFPKYPKHITKNRIMSQNFKIHTIDPGGELKMDFQFGETIWDYSRKNMESIDWKEIMAATAEVYVDYFECSSAVDYNANENLSRNGLFVEGATVLCDGKRLLLRPANLKTLKIAHALGDLSR